MRSAFPSIEKHLPDILRVTVPIFGWQDDRVVHDRTGVLYRVADEYFILTAAHDLREIVRQNIPLFIPGNPPIHLLDAEYYTTEVDARDVAAIRLSKSCVEKLHLHRDFMSQDRVECHDDAAGFYLLCGYPMGWTMINSQTVTSDPLIYLAHPYSGQPSGDSFIHGGMHLLLQFEQNATDLDGNKASLPAIKGMSGCGVWKMGHPDRPLEPALVAVQHRWAKERQYVQATRIAYVLDRILAAHPGLEAPMKLVYKKRRPT